MNTYQLIKFKIIIISCFFIMWLYCYFTDHRNRLQLSNADCEADYDWAPECTVRI